MVAPETTNITICVHKYTAKPVDAPEFDVEEKNLTICGVDLHGATEFSVIYDFFRAKCVWGTGQMARLMWYDRKTDDPFEIEETKDLITPIKRF